jgi:hypothetical protein
LADEKDLVLARLRELKAEHAAALGEGPGEAPGFTQDEQITRNSYDLVAGDALDSGTLTKADLQAAGLPKRLEESE